MAQNRKKTAAAKPKIKAAPTAFTMERAVAQSSAAEEALQFWDEAIEELVSEEFESVDAAVQAIVEKVITRLGAHGSDQTGVRNFLLELFHTDPELQQELRQILQIKA